MNKIRFEDSNDEQQELPAKWEICDRCNGNGRRDNIGVITGSEWHDEWAPEEQDAYMRGEYDVHCEDCKGTGKVLVVDRDHADETLLAKYDAIEEALRESEAMSRAERRFGA